MRVNAVTTKLSDIRVISYYTGRVIQGVALLMAIPMATSSLYGEWSCALDFLIGGLASWCIGRLLQFAGNREGQLGWIHGMVVSSISWIIAMALAAIPYALSGHFLSYLDAMFDAMSGFTTTGLVLAQDIDHLSMGMNMWRHIITFVGGQGMVVLALTFLFKTSAGGYKMYVGEGKDERLMPSVLHTSKEIWKISLIYMCMGTAALWLAGLYIGLEPLRAFWHGLWIFMAAWSTGGFAPQSQNILFYHSLVYEVVTVIIFIIGSLNFALHYSVWSGDRKETFRNIETASMLATLTILGALAAYALGKTGAYTSALSLFRKGFYNLVSGHTTTGFMTIYAQQFINEWGDVALWALCIAMLIGGSACSTAGGFKGLRVGIVFKELIHEARRLMAPESAVIVQKYRHIKDTALDDKVVKSAMIVIILYIATFSLGTLGGLLSGYSAREAIFEAASVTGNVGLSCGVTVPGMPDMLKILYILIMWVARLEFMSVIALVSFALTGSNGRRAKA